MKNILMLGIASVTTLLINNNNSRNKNFSNITEEKINEMSDIEFIEYLNYEFNLEWKNLPKFRKKEYRKIGFDEVYWEDPESNEILGEIYDLSWKDLKSKRETKTYLEVLKSLGFNQNTWDNYTFDLKENKIFRE